MCCWRYRRCGFRWLVLEPPRIQDRQGPRAEIGVVYVPRLVQQVLPFGHFHWVSTFNSLQTTFSRPPSTIRRGGTASTMSPITVYQIEPDRMYQQPYEKSAAAIQLTITFAAAEGYPMIISRAGIKKPTNSNVLMRQTMR